MKRLALAVALAGCDASPLANGPAPVVEGSASPVPSLVPQPNTQQPAVPAASARDGRTAPPLAPVPLPLTVGEGVAAEALPAAKTELAGVDLEARWRWPRLEGSDEAAAPKGRAGTDHLVQLSANGRMRMVFRSNQLPMPAGTELLARSDRYGSLLVWPDRAEYRSVPPGMLRATIGDRRLDALPLSKAAAADRGASSRLGLTVRRVELTSRFGTVTLEVARVREAGQGGALLCRALVELGGIEPTAPVCGSEGEGDVPLSASYAWGGPEGQEAARFEVTSLVAHEKDAPAVLVPPPELKARADGIPGPSSAVLVTDDEQAALGVGKDAAASSKSAGRASLAFVNRTDRTMQVVVDGTSVAYLAPNGRARLDGVRPSRHRVAWRSFFGEEFGGAAEVEAPATVRYPSGSLDDEAAQEER